MYYIYALVDPRTGWPRYVGCTRYPDQRYKAYDASIKSLGHLKNRPLARWLMWLRLKQLPPRMVYLQIVPATAAHHAERRWIRRLNGRGYALFNRNKTLPLHLTSHGSKVVFPGELCRRDEQRQRDMLRLRAHGMTYAAIGSCYGVSRQRVHQLLKVAAPVISTSALS